MSKYHLNPETGRVGVCKAEKQCPLIAAIHGETKEEARTNYEYTMMSMAFPVLKKEKPFEPKIIESLDDLEVTSGGQKDFYGKDGYSEIIWLKHEGEVIGYAKIMREKVWWNADRQPIPIDKLAKPEDKEAFYTVLADFEVRAPGLGHGRKILEKLHGIYGDIFTTGGATPEGAKFLKSNKNLFSQDPTYSSGGYYERTNIGSSEFDSSYESMSFVQDWDNSRSKFPL